MSELLEVEGAHPVWPDGWGRFGQSDLFGCVSRRKMKMKKNENV